jgi:hypothetical protein
MVNLTVTRRPFYTQTTLAELDYEQSMHWL